MVSFKVIIAALRKLNWDVEVSNHEDFDLTLKFGDFKFMGKVDKDGRIRIISGESKDDDSLLNLMSDMLTSQRVDYFDKIRAVLSSVKHLKEICSKVGATFENFTAQKDNPVPYKEI